ncbi:MAG: hypothetical protein HUU32_22185 [Calditrichaceae bacterium]|nr:hypothetical protein [Calditrichia bacterium]NUQ44102.1 hypothetical protein [Calditrichaceae bacterium]
MKKNNTLSSPKFHSWGIFPLRLRMASLMVIARLSWGEFSSPLHWRNSFLKFFPPPRKSVYKQGLANYFFRN